MAKRLSKRHLRELEEDSGISPEVIKARGYHTIKETEDLLRIGFAKAQLRVPGLLIPTHDASGRVVAHQYKPDEPRLDDGKPVKYETPRGTTVRLGIPPGAAARLPDATEPLWITEGAKKADAAVTAGLCCISLQGVNCWSRNGKPLADWESINLSGRDVFIAFDSDVMIKDAVRSALDGLTYFLRRRGARVSWVLLPNEMGIAGEEKIGLDDWLIANEMDPSGLAELLQVPDVAIKVNNVSLKDLTRQAIAALQTSNSPEFLFERDGVLVESSNLGVKPLDGKHADKRLRHLMSESADWYEIQAKGNRKAVNPPDPVVGDVMVAHELWNLNRLDRVVVTPVFAADGTLRTEPGYHGSSRSIYVPPEGLVVPPVSDSPTKKDVKRAKRLIEELFQDFVFVDDADRAAAWAMLLQPFARELIRGGTPLYSVQAPREGTGKTLLVQSALAPAVGDVESFSEPHKDEEVEKRLTTIMREAKPVAFFDNVTRFVSLPALASALTKPTWMGRVLGVSSTVSAPITCTFVITANNPSYSPEMLRRVVPIHLDARIEDPSSRTGFTHSLPAWALEHRGELIWAACTLISSWVAAGRPSPDQDTLTLGSYGPWRRVIGGILTHAKVPGFLENLGKKAADKSPDDETFEAVSEYAIDKFGSGEWWYMSDLGDGLFYSEIELTLSRKYRDVDELIQLLNPFLRKRKGQFVNGHVFEREPGRQKNAKGFMWRFNPVGATK